MIFDKIFGAGKKEETRKCPKCEAEVKITDLKENDFICTSCGAYFRMPARARIESVADEGSFHEADKDMKSINVISFPDYDEKLKKSIEGSGENEAVTCGICEIEGIKTAIFAMNSEFMMGSMGSVVGEKLTRLFEKAVKEGLPVVGFTTSGGARMQEGIYSLMQMAKVSGAVKRHNDAGLLYICVLTDPTTGGTTASFAMEGDITIAEPGALVGFAGARVIKQTTGQDLPKGFQRSEFLLEHGFVDMIEQRRQLKATLAKILRLHGGKI